MFVLEIHSHAHAHVVGSSGSGDITQLEETAVGQSSLLMTCVSPKPARK